MPTFYESENSPIASELVRQGFTLDRGEVLRIVDIDERASSTDTAIALGTAAISLVAACGTLALSGFTLPILAPITALGYAGLMAWNSRATKQEREFEAEFLHRHPEFVEAVNQKLEAGEESDRVAAAYEQTLKAFITGDRQRLHSFFPAAVVPLQMAPYPQESDSGPTIATASPIGNNTRLGAVEVPASPAAQSAPSLNMNSGSKGFDWHRLNTEYNDFPHLFLLGKTGAGKSYVSDRLVRFLDGYCIVISPKKMPADFQGLQVVGLPYDYRAIHRALVALEKLMVEREAEMQQTGFTDFQPINVILDELPVSSSGCKDLDLDLLKPLKTLIRAGRTSKIRLIILAQGSEVKALGIEGEGGLRDSLTYVYLKGFVEDHAAKSKIDISQIERPCIIEGQIADTSFLAQFKDTYPAGLDLTGQAARTKDTKWCQDKGMIPGTPEHLERIFNQPAADHEATGEVEEDAIETVSALASVQSAFPTWKPKSQDVAAKIVDWMAEREGKTFLPSEVRNGIRLLKGDKTIDNDRVKKLLDLLTEKQFISLDESGRYVFQKADDYDW